MKKLRCESCGGELEVEANEEYANCKYCRTRYKLNDNKTVVFKIDDSFTKVTDDLGKKIIPFAFVGVSLIMIFMISFGVILSSKHRTSVESENASNFNFSISHYAGTYAKVFVANMLDEISTNNKTNNRKITVVYNDKSVTDSDEIVKLKHSLVDKDYEIKFEYDSKGYINKAVIEDI